VRIVRDSKVITLLSLLELGLIFFLSFPLFFFSPYSTSSGTPLLPPYSSPMIIQVFETICVYVKRWVISRNIKSTFLGLGLVVTLQSARRRGYSTHGGWFRRSAGSTLRPENNERDGRICTAISLPTPTHASILFCPRAEHDIRAWWEHVHITKATRC